MLRILLLSAVLASLTAIGCADTAQMREDLKALGQRQDAAEQKLAQLVRQIAAALASIEAAISEMDKADRAENRRGQ